VVNRNEELELEMGVKFLEKESKSKNVILP